MNWWTIFLIFVLGSAAIINMSDIERSADACPVVRAAQ